MDPIKISTEAAQALTRDQYQALHDELSQARETCVDPAMRTVLRERAEAVQEVLTTLDSADLQAQTPEFEAAEQQIKNVNMDLQTLKDDINTIVQDVAIATKVAGAINSTLSAAAKLFG